MTPDMFRGVPQAGCALAVFVGVVLLGLGVVLGRCL